MKKIIVLMIFILLSVEFSGCINQANEGDKKNTELLIIGIAADTQGFFPWVESYDSNTFGINFNIFNPLVAFDKNFKLFPKLADLWNNPDNCTWRFFLRDDVTFHNGLNFTAYDVKYTIDFIKQNKSHVLWDLLTEVKEVNVVDTYIVDIVTYQPFPILLNKLTNVPIASHEYVEETKEKWPIGTGPYKLEEYIPGEHITLVRFNEYAMGLPVIKKVIYKIIENEEDRKNALLKKDIHILEHVPEKYVEEIRNNSGVMLKKISSPTVWYLGFNFRSENSSEFPETKNPLADLRVRKAMYHIIDMDQMIKILNLAAEPASQLLSPLIFGYNPEIKRLPYDANLSRQLLKDTGYENGFNVTLNCIAESVWHTAACEEIAKQLSQVINVRVNSIPFEEYNRQLYERNCSIYLLGWIPATGDGGEIFDFLLRSENHPLGIGSYNFGYYSNKTVDQITTEISYEMNQKTRLALMRQGFKVAMDDFVCIPLFINICNYAYADYLIWNPRSDENTLVEEITVK